MFETVLCSVTIPDPHLSLCLWALDEHNIHMRIKPAGTYGHALMHGADIVCTLQSSLLSVSDLPSALPCIPMPPATFLPPILYAQFMRT